MLGRVLKKFLPRGLYWRAALIVFLPVVTIMLVLSIGFIQRHYDGVTRQMTGNFILLAGDILARSDAAAANGTEAAETAHLSQVFEMGITPVRQIPELPYMPATPWYDISGRLAIRELRHGLPQTVAVALASGDLSLWLQGEQTALRLDFPLTRVSARNPHQLLVVVFFIGIVMSLISFTFLKNQMRPIRRLGRAADAFGRGQAVALRIAGATEVRAATKAFLQMRDRIERHIEQRTLMLSGVSHDLRTPLTRMRLALSMLEDDAETRALIADVVEMETMIDRFLEFARSEAVEPVVETDLAELIAQRLQDAARHGRNVTWHTLEPGLRVPLRPQLFTRALDNLISNALRYGTRAQVSLEWLADRVVVSVEDDGPGIAPEHHELAKRPFVRLDPARGASNGSGAGLGLAIVVDAMRSHGGKLELGQGESPGFGGLVARLILPRGGL